LSAKLESLLNLLSDNQWHNIDQIAATLEIPKEKIQQIATFLAETEIIQHNTTTNQIKLDQDWKTLLTDPTEKTQEPPKHAETPTIGTIIVPPQETLIIQCTRITNQTDNSLELEIRMNNKIREITINKIKQ